ncbi:MAG: hypothetical protein ABJE10_17350 [bacterium]
MVLLAVTPSFASGQSRQTAPTTYTDSSRLVFQPDHALTVVMHSDTAMWVRQKPNGAGADTVTFLVRGDSAWQLIAGAKIALNATRAAMLRRTIASNKRGIAHDSLFRHPPAP